MMSPLLSDSPPTDPLDTFASPERLDYDPSLGDITDAYGAYYYDYDLAALFARFRQNDSLVATLLADLVQYRKTRQSITTRPGAYSQAWVAKQMGTSQSRVALIERGDQDVLLSTLTRYAAALGLTLGYSAQDGFGALAVSTDLTPTAPPTEPRLSIGTKVERTGPPDLVKIKDYEWPTGVVRGYTNGGQLIVRWRGSQSPTFHDPGEAKLWIHPARIPFD